MLKKLLKEISNENKHGFVGFERIDESYYEEEEVDMRKVSKDMSARESKATSDLAKIIFDRLEANSRLGKKDLEPSKEKILKELNRLLRMVKCKSTNMAKKVKKENNMKLEELYRVDESKQNAWDVVLKGKVIDTIFYDADMTEDDVKRSLINHDGYNSNIKVVKSKIKGYK